MSNRKGVRSTMYGSIPCAIQSVARVWRTVIMTSALESDVPTAPLARLFGHSDLKMLTKIYDHTSPETLRNALLDAKGKATED